ncbi:hypothetical protein ACYZT9_04155 [Pseudomonas sp. ZT5P21]
MTSTRLKMSQEGLLWKTALEHLGPKDLHQFVVEIWASTRPAARPTVEYLDSDHVCGDVLNLLRIAQIAVGAVVPYRPVESGRIAIYSAHAEHLADKLLRAMPVEKLPTSLKGARLEIDMGM